MWIKFWDEKIKLIAKDSNSILDVGGGNRFQKGMKEYEEIFQGKDYKTLDTVSEYKPDIVGDIKNIPLDDSSVDAVICRAVLEHIDDPFKAVSEIYRVLKPNGKCLVSLPFLYPYHAEKGYYGDYYRFTKEGAKHMFKKFSAIEIKNIRGLFETLVNLIPIKIYRKVFSPLARIIDSIFKSKNQTSGFVIYLEK